MRTTCRLSRLAFVVTVLAGLTVPFAPATGANETGSSVSEAATGYFAALTLSQQQEIITAFVAVLNAAPGGYMTTWANFISNGGTIAQMYDAMATSSMFKSLSFAYSDAASTAQFATAFVVNLLGNSTSSANMQLAKDTVTAQLSAGASRGAAIKYWVDFLRATPTTDANWGAAAQLLANRIAVATDYTINQSGSATTLTSLQAVISSVTTSLASVTTAIASNGGIPISAWPISTIASPSAGGTVCCNFTGTSGISSFTVTATASAGYTFTNWTENGTVVSSSANYSFTASAARTLVANFVRSASTTTDAEVFAYAATNYPSLFSGAPKVGQYQQYHYRYYPSSQNYLAVDDSGVIYMLGPYTGNVIISVGPVASFASQIKTWEAVPQSKAFANAIADLSSEKGSIADTYFLAQFSGILKVIDSTANGPQQFSTHLYNAILGSNVSRLAVRKSQTPQNSSGVLAATQTSTRDVLADIKNSQTYQAIIEFLKSVIGNLVTTGIPEPAATALQAADPEIARGLIMAAYRKDLNDICYLQVGSSYCDSAWQQWNNGDYAGALRTAYTGSGQPLPSYLTPSPTPTPTAPPAACTYSYSIWLACQSTGIQTRTVTSSSPAGCTPGTQVLSQACTYIPPPAVCTYSYTDWSACRSDNTQTRTVTSSSPAGCTSSTQVLSQPCTYVAPQCTYWISPTSQSFESTGGNGSVDVLQNPGTCTAQNPPWTANSNTNWITSVSVGSSIVRYVVQSNTSTSSRNGTITVAGNTHTVTQSAGAAASPFQGRFLGTWSGTCPAFGDYRVSGSLTMDISASGNVSGSYSGSQSGGISGSVDAGGSLLARGTASGGVSWRGNFRVSGSSKFGDGAWDDGDCSGTWNAQ